MDRGAIKKTHSVFHQFSKSIIPVNVLCPIKLHCLHLITYNILKSRFAATR